MRLILTEESRGDFAEISNLIQLASNGLPVPFQNAAKNVERSRRGKAYLPRLSIVAKCDGVVVGHTSVLKTKLREMNCYRTYLVMLSHYVLPEVENNGVGEALMESIHLRAAALDYRGIVNFGDRAYFGRFGYSHSNELTVAVPPEGAWKQPLRKELITGGLRNVKGVVELPEEFYLSTIQLGRTNYFGMSPISTL